MGQYFNLPYVDKFRAQINQLNQKIAEDQKKAAAEAKKNGTYETYTKEQQERRLAGLWAKYDYKHGRKNKYGSSSSRNDSFYQQVMYREMVRQNQLLEEINKKLDGKKNLNTEG